MRLPTKLATTSTVDAPASDRHVIVNGTFVVRDEQLVPNATPGRPIRTTQP